MAKIKIKNFGPIKEGLIQNEGWINITKITLFIGNQGSGKSTIAKLISTLSWIEKSIVKSEIKENELSIYNRFSKRLEYQRINQYVQPDTKIEFQGDAYTLKYADQNFAVSKTAISDRDYILPKIMYVPAERNFLSVVDRPDRLKELPSPLFTFLDEYDRAKNFFRKGLALPINNVRFSYDPQNKIASISEDGIYNIRLSESSSGYQSTVPLFLVTKYLSEQLSKDENIAVSESSIEEQRRIEKEVQLIINDHKLAPDIRKALLEQLSYKSKPGRFINIVEEPEQNLFPTSQRNILNELIKYANAGNNSLIMTTHSPYLINYLSLCIKAGKLLEKQPEQEIKTEIHQIVPVGSALNPGDVSIFELSEKTGMITKLGFYEDLPSDENFLNQNLEDINELFAQLLEIEEKL